MPMKPSLPDVHYNLGIVLAENGDHRNAIRNFEEAITRGQGLESKVYVGLGTSLVKTEQYKRAIGSFEKVLQLKPNAKDVKNFLSLSYFRLGVKLADEGKIAEAIERIEESLRVEPGNKAIRTYVDQLKAYKASQEPIKKNR